MPALLQDASGAARLVLRAPCARGWRGHGAHRLRPFDRLLRRSDREEAAQSLPARLLGAVVRHRGLQPRLRLLPELGHFQEPRDGASQRARNARDDRAGRRAARVRQRRLYLQRSGRLHGICPRHGRSLPRARRQECRRHRGLRLRGAAQAPLRRDGRRERRSQGLHRALLRQTLRRARSRRCSIRSNISCTRRMSGPR